MTLKMHKETPKGPSTIKRVIAVAAGKGGVGKSFVAVHLARALASLGLQVGLLDADLYGPSSKRMLPEEKPPKRLPEGLLPAEASGIKLLSIAHFRSEDEASLVRAPIANGLIATFVDEALWGPLDVLIVDFPPGTGDIQLTLCQKLKFFGALLVTTPQKIALMDVLKSLKLFEEMRVPILGVVENMSYLLDPESGKKFSPFGDRGGEVFCRSTGVPLLLKIPLDEKACLASDEGKALFGTMQELFHALAIKIVEQQSSTEGPKVRIASPKEIEIAWNSEKTSRYLASKLQSLCPCADCHEKKVVDPEVEPLSVILAGRYGFRVKFSSGCSSGIYDFEALRNA